jgi:hypothetical protein
MATSNIRSEAKGELIKFFERKAEAEGKRLSLKEKENLSDVVDLIIDAAKKEIRQEDEERVGG